MPEIATTTVVEYRAKGVDVRLDYNPAACKPFYVYAGFATHRDLVAVRDMIDMALSDHPEPQPTETP